MPPGAARLILGAVPAAILGCLWIVSTAEVTVKDDKTNEDVRYKALLPTEHDATTAAGSLSLPAAFEFSFSDEKFYARVVDGVHHGEWYYDVLPRLFPEFHYRPFSIFNFRTPVYAWTLGLPPEGVGRLLLAGIGLAGLGLLAAGLARAHGRSLGAAGAILVLGGLGWCFIGPVYLFAEQWAGALIALSVGAYACDAGRWGSQRDWLPCSSGSSPLFTVSWPWDWPGGRPAGWK